MDDTVKEASLTIRRTLFLIVSYSAFCLVTLGFRFSTPPTYATELPLPVIDTKIPYGDFLLVGPLIIIGLVIYQQVFIGFLGPSDRSASASDDPIMPTIFTIPSAWAQFISDLLFYLLPPVVILLFRDASYSISDLPQDRWFLRGLLNIAAGATGIYLIVLWWKRRPVTYRSLRTKVSAVVVAAAFGCIAYWWVAPQNLAGLLGSTEPPMAEPSAPSAPPQQPAPQPQQPTAPQQPAPQPQQPTAPQQPAPQPLQPTTPQQPAPQPQQPAAPQQPAPPAAPVERDPTRGVYHAFYGNKGAAGLFKDDWRERYFRIESRLGGARFRADGDPQPGDIVVAQGNVNARENYIRFSATGGWVNSRIIWVIKPGDRLRVLEVRDVAFGYFWIKFQSVPK